MSGKKIKSCRLCGSKKISKVINFGKIPLGNNLLSKKELSFKAGKYPLILNNCKNCNHFQLGFSVNPKILYAKNYTYLSGTGSSMVNHLRNYSKYVNKNIKLNKKSLVVDIGSNDGTCLENFRKKGIKVLGIDPARKPCKIANSKGIKTINDFFNKKIAKKIINNFGKVDFVTSHNTLAHVDDIKSIFENIYTILKNDGHFCFEIGYFKEVLEKNLFDTIYHEHLDYHHANSLVKFLIKIGFSIKEIQRVDIQGGSLRILCVKNHSRKISKSANLFLASEKNTVLYNKKFIFRWENNVKKLMNNTRKKIMKLTKGNKVFGYGSPTKIILFLKLLKLPKNKLKYIFEDNLLKQNKFIPILGNKIISTMNIKKIGPKYILIFAWNFSKDIKKKVKKINKSINLIVPLPKFKIV